MPPSPPAFLDVCPGRPRSSSCVEEVVCHVLGVSTGPMVLHMVPFLVSLSGGFLVQPQAWLSSSPPFLLGAGRRPMVFHMVLCCLAPHLVKSPL